MYILWSPRINVKLNKRAVKLNNLFFEFLANDKEFVYVKTEVLYDDLRVCDSNGGCYRKKDTWNPIAVWVCT